MTFYDRTKEDSRVWRSVQDSQGQAEDNAAVATADAIQTRTTAFDSVTITTTPDTVNIPVNGQTTVTSAITGGFANTATYTSSNPTVAHVDQQGVITGHAVGTATITATSVDNQTKTDTVAVTVRAEGTPAP